MLDDRNLDPRHETTRATLRIVGPAVALVGLALTAAGMISFFSAFVSFEPPRYFWCAFIGLPLLGVGLKLTHFAYLGSIFRYLSGEIAPAARDTANYLAEGTAPGVRATARAVAEGFAQAHGAGDVPCPRCRAVNPPAANYCNHCGTSLPAP